MIGVLISETILTVLRPDPLKPIDHVERILHLIVGTSPFVVIVTLFAIALLFWPFISLRLSQRKNSTLAISFVSYLLVQFVVTDFRNFPVPVIGAGAAGVLGWYFIVGFAGIFHSAKSRGPM